MGLIIKNKRHFKTRLPIWILVIFVIGISPILIGLLGEILDSGSCKSGDCIWTTFPYFTMFTLPVAFILFLVFLVIVVFDSIRLYLSGSKVESLTKMSSISLYDSMKKASLFLRV